MKIFILAAAIGFLSAGLNAAENLNFTDAAFARQFTAAPGSAEVKVPEAPAPARLGRYVQVSGYVSLSGNTYISGPSGGYTSVPMSGWASFRDSSGQILSNSMTINVYASAWIRPNQYVSQMVNPSVYVEFYRQGRPVGSATMTGSITVTGWPSGNYVSLSGYGNLNGSVYVQDPE